MSRNVDMHFNFFPLNALHVLNDGFQASLLLLLPFIASDLKINLSQVGVLGTLVYVFAILLAIPSGYLANKIGGLKVLVAALFIYGLGFLGTGLSSTFLVLLLTFTLSGVGFALFHPIAFALVAKWSPKEKRGRIMGNFTAIGDLGRIGITALLTFIVIRLGWRSTSLLFSLLVFLLVVASYFFLKKNNHDKIAEKTHDKVDLTLWKIVKEKKFILASCISFFDCFASSSLFVFLPFLLLKRGVSPAYLGSFAAAFFIGNFLGKSLLGKFVDKLGNSKVFIISELIMACFIFFLANSISFYLIIICSIILGVFTKGTVPIVQTIVTESVEHHGNFEKAFGFNSLIASIASTIAPLLLGLVADRWGIVISFNTMACAAIIAIIPAIGFHFAKTKHA